MSTELEQQLRGAMERFTEDVRLPPGLAVRAHRHQQKRRMTTRAVAAAGTVTAVAAAVAVAGAAGAFGPASHPPVRTAYTVYVISHVEHALAAPRTGNLVEADRTTFPPGSTLQPFSYGLRGTQGGADVSSQWDVGYALRWIYHGSVSFSSFTAGGQHAFDWGITPAHGSTAVIYGNHTWWTAPAQGGQGGGGPAACIQGRVISLAGGAGNGWPAFIRSQLACGAYTVAGRQVIGGVNTIKITGASGQFTFWVDPGTYLPVAMTMGQKQTEFRWLAPTPANLARLKVTVPAGFRHVPAPTAPPGQAP
ncbi:MAG TPA: hypothetical protein VIE45_09270 [Streptosporangiaceae bacterium]|jgi:hypothetical protein